MRKHTYYYLVSLICLIMTSSGYATQNLIMGTIKFPRELETIPSVRLYHGGKIIKGTVDQENKSISFSLPKFGAQFRYTVVVTPTLDFGITPKTDESAMIDYMKLPLGEPYKMYTLLLVPKFKDAADKSTTLQNTWRIKQDMIINSERKIPDDALVLCFDPEWIDKVVGNSEFELPTIQIKPCVATLCGSESKFQDEANKILLAALDSDTFHASDVAPNTQQKGSCIMVAAPIA